MSSIAQKLKIISLQFLIYVVILFVLFLTSNNIQSFLSQKKVLGIQTNSSISIEKKDRFWNDFLTQHPNYIPGWIEIGRMDKASEIDPNFVSDKSE